MQVAEHFVRFPSADQADDVGVDACAKEGHGPAGAQATSGNAVRVDVEGGGGRFGGYAECLSDGVAADGQPHFIVADHVEWCRRGSVVRAEMEHTAKDCEHGARKGIAGAGVANAFAPNAVLLVRKREVHRSGGVEGVGGGGGSGQVQGAGVEGDVLEAKGRAAGVGVGGIGVFTGTTEEKETDQ